MELAHIITEEILDRLNLENLSDIEKAEYKRKFQLIFENRLLAALLNNLPEEVAAKIDRGDATKEELDILTKKMLSDDEVRNVVETMIKDFSTPTLNTV